MPRPTFFNSPKFALAQRRLKEPDAHLLGHLEFMWAAANECGEPVFRSAEQVEAAARWDGEEGLFALTLSKDGSNFLDAKDDGTYEIHDFWHHCPDYVRKRRSREQERQLSKDNGGQRLVSDRSTADNGRPPTPTPTPTPTHKKTPSAHPGFDEFYQAYPRHQGKADAFKAWNSTKPDLPTVLTALEWQRQNWTDPKYVPLPATYLRGRRWEDERTTSQPAPKKPKVDPSDPQYAEIMELLK